MVAISLCKRCGLSGRASVPHRSCPSRSHARLDSLPPRFLERIHGHIRCRIWFHRRRPLIYQSNARVRTGELTLEVFLSSPSAPASLQIAFRCVKTGSCRTPAVTMDDQRLSQSS